MLRHAPFVEERPVPARVDDVDLPVVAVQGEQAADVDAQRVGDVVVRQREALDHVADARLDGRQAEIRPQAPVGHDVDARDLSAAEVERHPVRLAVIERGEQSLA